jgi:hypothetical protein
MNGYEKLQLLLKDKDKFLNILIDRTICCPSKLNLHDSCGSSCKYCWEKSLTNKYKHKNINRRTMMSGYSKMKLFTNDEEIINRIVTNELSGCPHYFNLKDFCDGNSCKQCWEISKNFEYE